MSLDLFKNSCFPAEEAHAIQLIKDEYCRKLSIRFYDNDASHPGNTLFIKHGDPKSLKGVDRSTITGSLEVYENSQTFISCTPNDILPEDPCNDESEDTWNVPYWLATNFIHMFIHVSYSHPTILQCHHIDFLLISEYYPECPCSLVV